MIMRLQISVLVTCEMCIRVVMRKVAKNCISFSHTRKGTNSLDDSSNPPPLDLFQPKSAKNLHFFSLKSHIFICFSFSGHDDLETLIKRSINKINTQQQGNEGTHFNHFLSKEGFLNNMIIIVYKSLDVATLKVDLLILIKMIVELYFSGIWLSLQKLHGDLQQVTHYKL